MVYYYSLLTSFFIILAIVIIDPNVETYMILLIKSIQVDIQRIYWMIRLHPIMFSSPIVKWWMMRKYMRTVRELSQEAPQKDQDAV